VALAPHRIGGPKGVGILHKQRRARLSPLLHGGAQELGWRAGTENIPGIVGAGLALGLPRNIDHIQPLQMRLWEGIRGSIQDVRLNGPAPGPGRLPNSLNVSFAGLEGEGLALALDMKGFSVTSGQACSTKASKTPAVLQALGVPEEYGPGTIIISFGPENTIGEVSRLLEALPPLVAKLRQMGGSDFLRT